MVEALRPGYYLDNFEFVLEFVGQKYPDLLNAEERSFAADFRSQSLDAKRLYVRLTGRKGPLFREDKLKYSEIEAVGAAIDELAANGFVDHADDAEVDGLLALLTRPELVALLRGDSPRAARRDEIEALCKQMLDSAQMLACMPFRIVRPLRLDPLLVYRLLFFGNMRQDLTEFVLHELGITPYESYPIDQDTRFFGERQVLEETIALYNLSEQTQQVIEEGQSEQLIAIEALIADVHEQLAGRASKIRNRIARELERLGELDAALLVYEKSDLEPARERRSRILAKVGRAADAMALCQQIAREPDSEAEYEFAISFGHRLAKKFAIRHHRLPPRDISELDQRTITIARQAGVSVEELARRWFEHAGQAAFYVENGLMPGLFGLAFWDIIFLPVRGTFFNPFQRGPSDLFTPDFRKQRQALIDARFEALADIDFFYTRVMQTFAAKSPIANYFVNWGILDEKLLRTVFERIPAADLLKIFQRLLRDPGHNCSGLPDLIVFPTEPGYRLVEVKGPGDALQNNQKRWLAFFKQQHIPAEVAYVKWQS